MKKPSPTADRRVIVRGIHLALTPALHAAALAKAEHLLDHQARIECIRLDLELDRTRHIRARFIAKGRLELSGPDLLASASSEDAYKSLDLLEAKLAELLRRRHEKRVKTRNDARRQVPALGRESE